MINPDRAHTIVKKAKDDGFLPDLNIVELPCSDCAERASCYDHRYYQYPLLVEPVCSSCNTKRGPALDFTANNVKISIQDKHLTIAEAALKRAIFLAGGSRKMAKLLNITRQAVESWAVAPATRAAKIEAETGVQRVELRPDIYG
jgi:hypothetical protein